MWDYAEVSKMISEGGGPEIFFDDLKTEYTNIGYYNGQKSMIPYMVATGVIVSLFSVGITIVIAKSNEYYEKKKIESQINAEKSKDDLDKYFKK